MAASLPKQCRIDRSLADPSCIDISDQHLLARYRDKLGPGIGVSLYMGNWEVAIWPLVVTGANPAALYRAIDNPYIDVYLRAKRQALYPAGLIGRRRSDAGSLRTAHRLMHYVSGGGRAWGSFATSISDEAFQCGSSVERRSPSLSLRSWRAPRRPGVDSALPPHRHGQPLQDQGQGALGARTATADVRGVLAEMHRHFEGLIHGAPDQ